MHTVCSILGPVFFRKAPWRADVKFATDLIVLETQGFSVAVRVRRMKAVSGYDLYNRFKGQFTIREWLPGGAPTELAKIAEGCANVMFYGWGGATAKEGVPDWHVLNLDVWRAVYRDCGCSVDEMKKRGLLATQELRDGTRFVAGLISNYPKQFVIASSKSGDEAYEGDIQDAWANMNVPGIHHDMAAVKIA